MASPTEHDQLKASNDQREAVLAAQGIMAGGQLELYHTLLLESILGHVAGPEAIDAARLLTERKRQEKLDQVEAQVRKARLGVMPRPHGAG